MSMKIDHKELSNCSRNCMLFKLHLNISLFSMYLRSEIDYIKIIKNLTWNRSWSLICNTPDTFWFDTCNYVGGTYTGYTFVCKWRQKKISFNFLSLNTNNLRQLYWKWKDRRNIRTISRITVIKEVKRKTSLNTGELKLKLWWQHNLSIETPKKRSLLHFLV